MARLNNVETLSSENHQPDPLDLGLDDLPSVDEKRPTSPPTALDTSDDQWRAYQSQIYGQLGETYQPLNPRHPPQTTEKPFEMLNSVVARKRNLSGKPNSVPAKRLPIINKPQASSSSPITRKKQREIRDVYEIPGSSSSAEESVKSTPITRSQKRLGSPVESPSKRAKSSSPRHDQPPATRSTRLPSSASKSKGDTNPQEDTPPRLRAKSGRFKKAPMNAAPPEKPANPKKKTGRPRKTIAEPKPREEPSLKTRGRPRKNANNLDKAQQAKKVAEAEEEEQEEQEERGSQDNADREVTKGHSKRDARPESQPREDNEDVENGSDVAFEGEGEEEYLDQGGNRPVAQRNGSSGMRKTRMGNKRARSIQGITQKTQRNGSGTSRLRAMGKRAQQEVSARSTSPAANGIRHTSGTRVHSEGSHSVHEDGDDISEVERNLMPDTDLDSVDEDSDDGPFLYGFAGRMKQVFSIEDRLSVQITGDEEAQHKLPYKTKMAQHFKGKCEEIQSRIKECQEDDIPDLLEEATTELLKIANSKPSRKLVQDSYAKVIPLLISLLKTLFTRYKMIVEDVEEDEVTFEQGQDLKNLTATIVDFEQEMRNWDLKPWTDVPIVKHIQNNAIAPLKRIRDGLHKNMRREERRRETAERCLQLSQQARHRADLEVEERETARLEKDRSDFWRRLNELRVSREDPWRRHLISLKEIPKISLITHNANGNPEERMPVFRARTRPPGVSTDLGFENGTWVGPWKERQIDALFEGLQRYSMADVFVKYDRIFHRYCGPDGPLRDFNCEEIYNKARSFKPIFQAMENDGEEPEWVRNIPDQY